MEGRDLFGFLPCKWIIEFDGGLISPIVNYEEVANWVDENTNKDGFLYPPIIVTMQLNPDTMEIEREIPKTKRPALLYKVPASHEILLNDVHDIKESFRKGPGGFLIHLLAYLFGTRLQFKDWWFDGRIPIESTHNINITKDTLQHFISHSYNTWKIWGKESRTLITNILYMLSRAPSYEWDWERFTIEYMVFDGCFKLATMLNKVNIKGKSSHKDRIRKLCDKFEIPYKGDIIINIVELRNDLFHETLWDKSQPCHAGSSSAFMHAYNLRRLNQRLIPILLNYKTPYVNTGWCFLGRFSFEQAMESQ